MSDFRQEAVALATEHGCKDLCELGVWRGELSVKLAEIAETLILVDPMSVAWNKLPEYVCTMGEPEKTQEELDEMWSDLKRDIPWARFLRMDSLSAAAFVEDGTLDFIFIDSVHTYEYCLAEIKAWLPKLRPGGIMAGDDYVPEHRAVAMAVDEVFGKKPRQGIWWEKVK